MRFVFIAMMLYLFEWVGAFFGDFKWDFLLGFELLTVALLVSGILVLYETKSVLAKSAICLWALMAWGDVLKFVLWAISDRGVDLSIPIAILFSVWLFYILRREYDRPSDPINPRNVTLLIKRPRTIAETFKALFGTPSASVCISVGTTVWSFRKRTNAFGTSVIGSKLLESHIAIDTGVYATDTIISALNAAIGVPRGAACKCVYTIRHPLNMLGGKFRIQTWLDYVPSFYTLRIL